MAETKGDRMRVDFIPAAGPERAIRDLIEVNVFTGNWDGIKIYGVDAAALAIVEHLRREGFLR